MNWLKVFKDYSHQCGVAVALFLILVTGINVNVQLALHHPFPEGYDTFLWVLSSLAGVGAVGMVGIRATGVPYAAAKAGAAPPGPAVTVEGNAQINAAAPAVVPQAGVKPRDPAVRQALERAAVPASPLAEASD